jgi:hypothetical protein
VSTTICFSGLHHAAGLLACLPASYAHCWVCTWSALLACWLGFGQGGREPSVLTHWVTATNFLGLRLIPRSRAYLGAITTQSGGVWNPRVGAWTDNGLISYNIIMRCTSVGDGEAREGHMR